VILGEWGESFRPSGPKRGVYVLPPRLSRLPVRVLPGELFLHAAVTGRSRLLGLAALPPLAPAHGLWLPGTRSVHTAGMRFALDLLWCDGRGRVVRVDEAVGPWRVRTCRAAASVIEVAAGAGGRWAASLRMDR